MTLTEAILTGRDFRRPFWTSGTWVAKCSDNWLYFDEMSEKGSGVVNNNWFPSPQDVLATDWEVRPETVNITLNQLWRCYRQVEDEEAAGTLTKQHVYRLAELLGLNA